MKGVYRGGSGGRLEVEVRIARLPDEPAWTVFHAELARFLGTVKERLEAGQFHGEVGLA